MSTDEHLAELGEAARRAGSLVTEQITSIVEGAERQAERLRADAEVDAERTRREAVDSARRLLQHLHALEQPLGQLVMNLQAEVDRVAGELGSGGYVDSQATAIPAPPPPIPDSGSQALEQAQADEAPAEQGSEHRRDEPPAEIAEQEPSPSEEPQRASTGQVPSTEQPPLAPSSEADSKPRRRFLGRVLPSRSRTFVSTEGYCAVCQRPFMAGSEENLKASGWRVTGDIGLCPNCQSEGWQLPEGARLPFRRGTG